MQRTPILQGSRICFNVELFESVVLWIESASHLRIVYFQDSEDSVSDGKLRVLLTTQPGTGHLRPLMPLAQALQTAGHTVAVACAPSFARWVVAAGLEAIPAGLDWLESEPELAFPEMAAMSPAERDEMLTEIFTDISANQMTYDLLECCPQWKPDLLVRDYSEYGACLAGEILDIPHAVVGLGLYIPNYITRLSMEKPLAYLRSAYGLPPHPAMEMLTRYLYLSLVPRSFQFPEYPMPPVLHSVRFPEPESGGAAVLPEWVATLPKQPTVYVSMGTVFNRAPEIFREILDGLQDEPLNLILTIGRNQDPAQFGKRPANVHIEQFIPQAALMPYCDLVITHGGINTILIGLGYGLPLVVIPLVGHQLQNVVRCKALGVGIPLLPREQGLVLDAATVAAQGPEATQSAAQALFGDDSATFNAASVRETVRTLLGTSSYRAAAQRLQAEMAVLPGPEYAVALLERLARERGPVTGEG